MSSFNKVILMGHLTRDPLLKQLPGGTSVCETGVAVNRKYKTAGGDVREEVVFVEVAAFGKTGEVINQYFAKGKPIFIEGRLKFDQWEDKQGGGKRSKLSVIVDSFQFVAGADKERESPPTRPAATPPPQPTTGADYRPAVNAPYGEDVEIPIDEIPF